MMQPDPVPLPPVPPGQVRLHVVLTLPEAALGTVVPSLQIWLHWHPEVQWQVIREEPVEDQAAGGSRSYPLIF